MVVADLRGTVLWRSGSHRVLDQAARLGFVEGANWAEDSVGTNAIGTALVSRQAVQIFSAEHYARSHHPWTCAGAPIRDPRDDRVIGVVDISGPAKTVHPTTLALVDAVARLAQSHLRDKHRDNLDQLRSVAGPMLARSGSPALVIDTHGWVAAVDALPHRSRVLLPAALAPGRTWFPALGLCELDPLPGVGGSADRHRRENQCAHGAYRSARFREHVGDRHVGVGRMGLLPDPAACGDSVSPRIREAWTDRIAVGAGSFR